MFTQFVNGWSQRWTVSQSTNWSYRSYSGPPRVRAGTWWSGLLNTGLKCPPVPPWEGEHSQGPWPSWFPAPGSAPVTSCWGRTVRRTVSPTGSPSYIPCSGEPDLSVPMQWPAQPNAVVSALVYLERKKLIHNYIEQLCYWNIIYTIKETYQFSWSCWKLSCISLT